MFEVTSDSCGVRCIIKLMVERAGLHGMAAQGRGGGGGNRVFRARFAAPGRLKCKV